MIERVCLLLAVAIAMWLLPGSALAQPMVGGFQGTVSAGAGIIPDGTSVSGWIDGTKVGEVQALNSSYSMFINGDYTGKTVTFKVGKYDAAQTAQWTRGQTLTVNLVINSWPYQCDFYGLVTLNGNHVPDDTEISAWIDGAKVQTTTTTDSLYRLLVPGNYTDKSVSFKVGNDFATQIGSWKRGMEINLDLTVSLGPPVSGFYGSVKLDGKAAIDGIQISAWIDGTKVQTTATAASKYGLNIPGDYDGKKVTFQINGQKAAESAIWARGQNSEITLTAITTGTPVVTFALSAQELRPGQEFTLTLNVDPKGHGISGGELDLLSIDSSVMELVMSKVSAGSILGTDAVEGVKSKTSSDTEETLQYALARKGVTTTPTAASNLATVALRVKASARAGKYAIPTSVSLTDENFNDLDFAPPTVSITVVPNVSGDIDGDTEVGLKDLAILASSYGKQDGDADYRPETDLNSDREVGIADLAILAGNWGKRSLN